MSIYVVTKGEQIIGTCTRKYNIKHWASDKTEEEKENVWITRYPDGFSEYRHPVRFSLEDYLADPKKKFT